MTFFFLAFLISCLACIAILLSLPHHLKYTNDSNFHEPQKFHSEPIPRVGGLAIFIAIAIEFLYSEISQPFKNNNFQVFIIHFGSYAVFSIGLLEDITKKFSANLRLFLIIFISLVTSVLAGITLPKPGIVFLDNLLLIPIFACLLTTLGVAGITNAYNIIDGLNGLASSTALITLVTIAILTYKVNDIEIFYISILIASAIAGFIVFNFPWGKIFLGDGGAYLIGFWTVCLTISAVNRNTQNFSPWLALILNLYPIIETVFSIARRLIKGVKYSQADTLHLHTLIYKINLMKDPNNPKLANNSTTLYFMIKNIVVAYIAIVFYKNSVALIIICVVYVVLYIYLHYYLTELLKRYDRGL